MNGCVKLAVVLKPVHSYSWEINAEFMSFIFAIRNKNAVIKHRNHILCFGNNLMMKLQQNTLSGSSPRLLYNPTIKSEFTSMGKRSKSSREKALYPVWFSKYFAVIRICCTYVRKRLAIYFQTALTLFIYEFAKILFTKP